MNVRIGGLGSEHRTAIFPKLIFTLKRGLNLEVGTPNYDIKELALECSTKRMYPDILSYDKIVELTGSFKASMGCRSFLQGWRDENGNDVTAGRNNLELLQLIFHVLLLKPLEIKKNSGKSSMKELKLLMMRLPFVLNVLKKHNLKMHLFSL